MILTRLMVQRVKNAEVFFEDGTSSGCLSHGFLILIGFGGTCENETPKKLPCFEVILRKLQGLKIFHNGQTLLESQGGCLIVSQFTLFGSLKKGTQVSFSQALPPSCAQTLYDGFLEVCSQKAFPLLTGRFGAAMEITSTCLGPYTLFIECDENQIRDVRKNL